MATVWVYPEREYVQFGAVRYELSWETLKPSAEGKEEIDIDFDVTYHSLPFKDKDAAIAAGRKLVDAGETFFGSARVTKQVVDWFVEEDRIAEWTDTSDEVIID